MENRLINQFLLLIKSKTNMLVGYSNLNILCGRTYKRLEFHFPIHLNRWLMKIRFRILHLAPWFFGFGFMMTTKLNLMS